MTLYLDETRLRMAVRFVNAEWQERKNILMSDVRLMAAAQRHATDMAAMGYFDHVNRNGYWPNWRVKAQGYAIPYKDKANNVESIGMGFSTPEGCLEGMYASDAHRPHVTGNVPFFYAHRYFGVGYKESVKGIPYYVLVTAPPESVDDDEHNVFLPGVHKGIYRRVRVG
jgi:hypothetical protein